MPPASVPRRTALKAAIFLTAVPLAACSGKVGPSSGAPGKPRRGGRITVAQPFEPTRGSNFLVSDDPSLMTLLSGTVYSKLVEVKAGGTTGVEIART